MFPSYFPYVSVLYTHRVCFMISVFNRGLFCGLNLVGVFSGSYLSSINNSSCVADCPIFFSPVGLVKQRDQLKYGPFCSYVV